MTERGRQERESEREEGERSGSERSDDPAARIGRAAVRGAGLSAQEAQEISAEVVDRVASAGKAAVREAARVAEEMIEDAARRMSESSERSAVDWEARREGTGSMPQQIRETVREDVPAARRETGEVARAVGAAAESAVGKASQKAAETEASVRAGIGTAIEAGRETYENALEEGGRRVGEAARQGRKYATLVADRALAAIETLLVFLADTLPGYINRAIASFAIPGIALLALGIFAIAAPVTFMAILPYLLGAAFVLTGVGLTYAAWRIYDATRIVRQIASAARMIRYWRDELARREGAETEFEIAEGTYEAEPYRSQEWETRPGA